MRHTDRDDDPFDEPDDDDERDDDGSDDDFDPELEAELDEEFPLGDGVADTTGMVACPYCGEENELSLDPGGGTFQEYVEDCHVCCQPWRVHVAYNADGSADVSLQTADGE